LKSKMQSGYSAPEQYSTTSWQNTQTDVYGAAATFYRCLTGATPQDAEQRISYDTLEPPIELNPSIPQFVSRAVMLAMLVNINERTQTIGDFRDMLDKTPPDASATKVLDSEEMAAAGKRAKIGKRRPALNVQPPRSSAAARRRDESESDDEDGEDEASARGKGLRAAVVIVAVLAVLIGMFFLGRSILASLNPEETEEPVISSLTVPNYVGSKLSEITFDSYNFYYVYEYVTDNSVEDNIVTSQSPAADSAANTGDTITLYINKSERNTKMIQVVGYSEANAIQMLNEAGIKYEITYEQTGLYAAGIVFRQSIQEGVSINSETQSVTLFVARADSGTATTTTTE
ncbi:MAG: PASTA domain-containing protein, partial [Oscillospiraceae bacterium]|nr:PASTA domain-containing protein [Oscillospiraceae bacterium]